MLQYFEVGGYESDAGVRGAPEALLCDAERHLQQGLGFGRGNLIAASICDKYSVGLSIQPICTRCYFTTTHMIHVCSKLHCTRVFIINTRPDGMRPGLA